MDWRIRMQVSCLDKVRFGTHVKHENVNNPSADIVTIEKAKKLLGFINAILYSYLPVPFPESHRVYRKYLAWPHLRLVS